MGNTSGSNNNNDISSQVSVSSRVNSKGRRVGKQVLRFGDYSNLSNSVTTNSNSNFNLTNSEKENAFLGSSNMKVKGNFGASSRVNGKKKSASKLEEKIGGSNVGDFNYRAKDISANFGKESSAKVNSNSSRDLLKDSNMKSQNVKSPYSKKQKDEKSNRVNSYDKTLGMNYHNDNAKNQDLDVHKSPGSDNGKSLSVQTQNKTMFDLNSLQQFVSYHEDPEERERVNSIHSHMMLSPKTKRLSAKIKKNRYEGLEDPLRMSYMSNSNISNVDFEQNDDNQNDDILKRATELKKHSSIGIASGFNGRLVNTNPNFIKELSKSNLNVGEQSKSDDNDLFGKDEEEVEDLPPPPPLQDFQGNREFQSAKKVNMQPLKKKKGNSTTDLNFNKNKNPKNLAGKSKSVFGSKKAKEANVLKPDLPKRPQKNATTQSIKDIPPPQLKPKEGPKLSKEENRKMNKTKSRSLTEEDRTFVDYTVIPLLLRSGYDYAVAVKFGNALKERYIRQEIRAAMKNPFELFVLLEKENIPLNDQMKLNIVDDRWWNDADLDENAKKRTSYIYYRDSSTNNIRNNTNVKNMKANKNKGNNTPKALGNNTPKALGKNTRERKKIMKQTRKSEFMQQISKADNESDHFDENVLRNSMRVLTRLADKQI